MGQSQGVKIYKKKSVPMKPTHKHRDHVIEVKGSHYIHMVIFGQFISQKLVNLHIIWIVGSFGTIKAVLVLQK